MIPPMQIARASAFKNLRQFFFSMGEFYLQPELITPEAWETIIHDLRDQVARENIPSSLSESWSEAFTAAVLERARHENIGVLFSGGVDSTFIAFLLAKYKIPFTCYTIGFHDTGTKQPEDIHEAKRVAEYYGWKHKYRVLNMQEIGPIVQRVVGILGDAANPTSVGVATVVLAAAELAAQDDVRVLFGGLGSEEIFAGYQRHEKATVIQDECWNGLLRMYDRDLIRDSRIAASLHIEVPTPFLDPKVIRLAMLMPGELKIKDGHKKYALRLIAEQAGLKHEFAFRPKRAAQYGSRVHKALYKLARDNGFPDEETYVESLKP
jgi:diphthine-ammonia ligase